MRRRRPSLLLLGASVAVLTLAGEVVVSTPAAASGTGLMTGTVTDTLGHPLAGICVDLKWLGGGGGQITANDGTYTFESNVPETITVSFTGGSLCEDNFQPGPDYAAQYYDGSRGGTTDPAAATPVDVTPGQTVSGIDAVMAAGGSITGTVTAADGGAPLEGACVQAQDESGGWKSDFAGSGADGTYLIDGLPAGDFAVAFSSDSPASPIGCVGNFTGYVPQWYDHETSAGAADPVPVSNGAVTGSINAALAPTGPSVATTTVTATPDTSISGQPVTFSASVSGLDGTPAGTVGFTDSASSGNVLCVATLSAGSGSCTGDVLSLGTSTVTGTYSGDTSYAASSGTTPITVETPPSFTITDVQAQPASSIQGNAVTLSASVSSSDGPPSVGDVAFTVGSTPLCTAPVSDGQASCSSSSAPVGTDTVLGFFSGGGGFPASSATTTLTVSPAPVSSPSAGSSGYDLVGRDGGVFVFPTGQSGGFYGSLPGFGVKVNNIVGMVASADDHGYFLVGSDGGVFAFGHASFEGSLPGLHARVNDIKGIVPTTNDDGYFLVGSDGGVFAFGAAPFLGSLPGKGIHVDDIIGIAATPSDLGYWLVASNGTVYAFGNAPAFGSATDTPAPVSSITSTPDGGGYWIATQAGGVYPFGDAGSFGSLPSLGVRPSHPVIGLVPIADNKGYWLIGSDGGIFAFGDAPFVGSLPALGVHVTDVVGAVPTTP